MVTEVFFRMKATGIVRRIDELGRVVIPKEIRRTLRIREGDALEVYTDSDGGVILKKYSPIGELGDFAKEYAESLHQSVGYTTLICDKDCVIAVSGVGKSTHGSSIAVDKAIHPALEKLMTAREKVNVSKLNGDDMYPIMASDDNNDAYSAELIIPILASGDAIGAVILLSKDDGVVFGQTEVKVAETAASFMGKQLEN